MDRPEFEQFLDLWRARLPECGKWLDSVEEPEKMLSAWFDIAFAGFTLPEAEGALDAIQRGEWEYPTWKWQETPYVFRQIVTEYRQAELEADRRREPDLGQRRESCPECHGQGLVYCFHVDSMAAARRQVLEGTPMGATLETGVACVCPAGDKYAKWHVRRGDDVELPRFDPERWIRIERGLTDQENRARLFEWARAF
jgi:hypothetical protein